MRGVVVKLTMSKFFVIIEGKGRGLMYHLLFSP